MQIKFKVRLFGLSLNFLFFISSRYHFRADIYQNGIPNDHRVFQSKRAAVIFARSVLESLGPDAHADIFRFDTFCIDREKLVTCLFNDVKVVSVIVTHRVK